MRIFAIVWAALVLTAAVALAAEARRSNDEIDAEVAKVMAATGAQGLAIAYIENGTPVYVQAYGKRNAAGDPLQVQTIMYGASLTKAAFGHLVVQLADEGKINLDASIATYLPRPLPDYPTEEKYAPWSDLKGDERWRRLTPRILLTHSSGFANFAFIEPDGKLRFHFEPGSRYAYSGEGLILLQFVLEKGLGLDVGEEMQRRVFEPFGMTNTSMIWRPDFAANLADGWDVNGRVEPHDERSKVRAAGSMDTTIDNIARLAAGYVSGEGISPRARAELTKAHLPITTVSQFPSLQPELPPAKRRKDLAAGVGVIVFKGPQGSGFYKGGHNDTTANTWVCVETRRSCVVILSNDVRAEPGFPRLVKFLLGETGVPWTWEYGDMKFVP
jgi:CubicO group peptidase (beta-lactamase class C family)